MQRRQFLASMGALGASTALGTAWAGPGAQDAPDARFVIMVLRGGLDGLAAVVPYGDPHYASARGDLALPEPGRDGGVLDLDGTFGLHPALVPLAPLVASRSLLAAHAVAVPYHERSHFDGQNVLETGGTQPFATRSGWLSRALGEQRALAVGKTVPLLLRGPGGATSLDPLRTPRPDAPLHQAVAAMYEGDEALSSALAKGMDSQRLLARYTSRSTKSGGRNDVVKSARIVARLLGDANGPRTAVFSVGGWDTHTNQSGRLTRQLGALGKAIVAFREEMTPEVWDRTVVLAVTEFGRTVVPNGTGGTDHGVGGVALIAGGSVAGGRVIADWPGLRQRDRLEGRDLKPTTDLRSLTKGLLHEHLRISDSKLSAAVFPGSERAPRLQGLLRS